MKRASKEVGITNGVNRKQRKQLARRIWSADPGLEVMHANAAGIDIGAQEHLVAVAPGRSQEPVRAFGSFTGELLRMAEWLHDCGVQTVVMQSTGVYWMPVYEVLEQAGFAVWLVNARHRRNLPRGKSDVQESQWLLKLHSYGMLNNSFLPSNEIRVLRRYWRQRDLHVKAAGSSIQRIQKVLTEMNVQLGNVVSDLSGETGMAIVRAIAGGERNAEKLAKLRNYRLRASEQEVARSLQGNWREELLFVLKQEIDIYDQYRQRIRECDEQLQGYLRTFADRPSRVPAEPPSRSGAPAAAGARRRKAKGNQSNFDLHSELKRIGGVDLTKIDGIDVIAAQTILSEVGLDLGRCGIQKPTLLPGWGTGRLRLAHGGAEFVTQSKLSRRPIPVVSHQTRSPQSLYRNGS